MTKPELTIEKQYKNHGYKTVLINVDIHQRIKELSEEGNVSMTQIVRKFLWYGWKHVKVLDETEGKRDV